MHTLNILSENVLEDIVAYFKDDYLIRGDEHIASVQESYGNEGSYEVFLQDRKSVTNIPIFYLPIVTEIKGKKYSIIDVRSFVTGSGDDIRTNAPMSVAFAALKANFALSEHLDNTGIFRSSLTLAGNSFVNMLVNILQTNWNLSHADSYYVRALAAILYGANIASVSYGDDRIVERAYNDVRKWAGISMTPKLDEFVTKYASLSNVDEFVDILRKTTSSSRLRNGLTYGALLTSFVKVSYGAGVPETLAVSLNNPVLYAAVVANSASNKMVRNTLLSRDLDNFRKKESYAELVKHRESIIGTVIEDFR